MSYKPDNDDWVNVKVGELGRIVTGKTPKTSISANYGGNIPFLTPSDDMSQKYSGSTKRTLSTLGVLEVKNCLLPENAVCVSCIGSDLGKVTITVQPTVTNQQINSIIVDTTRFDIDFIYYAMRILGTTLNYVSKTSTAVPIVNKSSFSEYEISVPSLDIQQKISSALSVIDDKIALNTRINDNLQQQADAIFDENFPLQEPLPVGWRKSHLSSIAKYLNGLAMQKYRPAQGENGLPVLKIKELRQGMTDDNSDRCSANIKPEYIVHDGDIIFSWSGSLLVDFWCGGDCGLNQHLFKVTSTQFDKWFVYAWTKHYLNHFIAVAADKATTMGHIKRDELDKAEVIIPSPDDYTEIGALMKPIYDKIISNRIESKKLSEIRDALLPRLMSGKLDVSGF